MLGTIEPGSFVVLKAQESYVIGDIIGYSTPVQSVYGGRNVVHRIIAENDDGFILQGDNNPKPDPGLVPEDRIMGEVILFTPFFGYVLFWHCQRSCLVLTHQQSKCLNLYCHLLNNYKTNWIME